MDTGACAATSPVGTPHGKPNKTPGHGPANPSLASSLSTRHLNHYTVLLLTLLAFDHLFTGWTASLRYELQASNWIESQACTFPCNLALINDHLLLTVIGWA